MFPNPIYADPRMRESGTLSPRVSLVMLNFNGWTNTIECLDSLFCMDYNNWDLILIDNGSSDESIGKMNEYLENRLPYESIDVSGESAHSQFRVINKSKKSDLLQNECQADVKVEAIGPRIVLICCSRNVGFAGANNIGIDYALRSFDPEFVLLLNNDVVVGREFLEELVKRSRSEARHGMSGPSILDYWNQNKRDPVHTGKVNLWTGDLGLVGKKRVPSMFLESMRVGWLSGCCLLVSIDAIREVGLLDPGYFLYAEDTDWCIRMVRKGYSLLYIPSSVILHKGRASSDGASAQFYYARSIFLLMRKNATRLQRSFFYIFFFVFRLWFHIGIILLWHHNVPSAKSFCKGVLEGITYES